jgi:hypothetical protein
MNDLRTSPTLGPSGDELEGMLRSFFRAEVPDPWPAMKAPAAVVKFEKPRRSTWLRIGPRLAVAACVAFLLLGYLALGSMFPKHQAVDGLNNAGPPIGKQDNRPRRVHTPSGREALMWEEKSSGERPTIIIQLQEIKGSNDR